MMYCHVRDILCRLLLTLKIPCLIFTYLYHYISCVKYKLIFWWH